MGTLMARVGSPLPPHESLGPLDDVLARAAAPEASARLDAAGFAARLGALASALPTPAPLPLQPLQHDGVAPIAGFRAPPVSELTEVAAVPGAVTGDAAAPVGTRAGPGEIFDAEPSGGERTSIGPSAGGPTIAQRPKRRRPPAWVIGAVLLVLVLVAGALVVVNDKVFVPSHPMPAVTGLTLAQARAAAAKDHFTLHAEAGVQSITVAAGSVVSQSPHSGTVLKQGATLSVVPSLGKPSVTVPPVVNMTCAQAITALNGAHLVGVCGAGQYSSTVNSGLVLSWSLGTTANPSKAAYGSTITLVPSSGHAPATVPTSITTSDTFGEAQAALQAVGLTATQANATSSTVTAGNVISTTPAPGTPAPYGSAVTVTISSGPPMVMVPNVLDDTVSQATTVLTDAGLVVNQVNGNPNRMVSGTNPPIGTSVPTGSSVTIDTF
jgi:serine/threonine-protein kinase